MGNFEPVEIVMGRREGIETSGPPKKGPKAVLDDSSGSLANKKKLIIIFGGGLCWENNYLQSAGGESRHVEKIRREKKGRGLLTLKGCQRQRSN